MEGTRRKLHIVIQHTKIVLSRKAKLRLAQRGLRDPVVALLFDGVDEPRRPDRKVCWIGCPGIHHAGIDGDAYGYCVCTVHVRSLHPKSLRTSAIEPEMTSRNTL